jgi:rhodanese-related sulfurtransferase
MDEHWPDGRWPNSDGTSTCSHTRSGESTVPALDFVSPVTEIAAAPSAEAVEHFARLLAFETDCWDVHEALERSQPTFVLLDVRSPETFANGHVPGAINLPHRRISERTLAEYGKETLFVVYCSGPHCNGADRAALRLARLGRPVKKMIGGIEGWREEGFELQR